MKTFKTLILAFLTTIIFIFSSCDNVSSSDEDSKQTIETKLEFSTENVDQTILSEVETSGIKAEESHIQLKITLKDKTTGKTQIATKKLSEKDLLCFQSNSQLKIKLDNVENPGNVIIDDAAIEYETESCNGKETFTIYEKDNVDNTAIKLKKATNVEILGILNNDKQLNNLENDKSYILTSDLTMQENITLNGIDINIYTNGHTIEFKNNSNAIVLTSNNGSFSNLNIYDGTITSKNEITSTKNMSPFINQKSAGQLNLYNVTLEDINLSYYYTYNGSNHLNPLINNEAGQTAITLKNCSIKDIKIQDTANTAYDPYLIVSNEYIDINNTDIDTTETIITPILVKAGSVFLHNGTKILGFKNNDDSSDAINALCVDVTGETANLIVLDATLSCESSNAPAIRVDDSASCYFTRYFKNSDLDIFESTISPTVTNLHNDGIGLDLYTGTVYFLHETYINNTKVGLSNNIISTDIKPTIYCLDSSAKLHTNITFDNIEKNNINETKLYDSISDNNIKKKLNINSQQNVQYITQKFPIKKDNYKWQKDTNNDYYTIGPSN